jgi:anaerobic selenocysteine-containing dehydrogenase
MRLESSGFGTTASAGKGELTSSNDRAVATCLMTSLTQAVTACPLDCPDTCSLHATVETSDDGRRRLIAVDAGPGNPMTDGWICAKVKGHADRVHGKDRVLTPLIRAGAKGTGTFRAASWDEALELVAGRIRLAIDRSGPGSVVPYLYNSSAGLLAAGGLGPELWRQLGATNVVHTICAYTAGLARDEVYGDMLSADPNDVLHAKLIVVWGANPTVANTHFGPLVNKARKSGARLVVVDPRRTAMAARADVHLAVRPGADVVLALAMARVMHDEGLLAIEFLAEHVDGLDEYLAAAEPWTLARAADICGIPADDIAVVAREYATTRPAFLRMGWGLERNRNGGSGCKAVLALPLLAGQFGQRGSGVMLSVGGASPVTMSAIHSADLADRRQFNQNLLGAELLGSGDPIEVLFVQGANPVVMNPDQDAVMKGMLRQDLFTVVHDQVLTDTARYADVVLPATTHFEVDDLAGSYGSYVLQRMPAVIDRVGESRTNDEVSAALADSLGLTGFDGRPESLIAKVLPAGVLDGGPLTLRPDGCTVQFVDTFPSFENRRARLFDPQSDVPVPVYSQFKREFPLTLLSPATAKTISSMFGERGDQELTLSLHPDDAAARGIADGDDVEVWNELGIVALSARIDGSVRPGVVCAPKGNWLRDYSGSHGVNVLVPALLSDLGSGACFNDAYVDVRSRRKTNP